MQAPNYIFCAACTAYPGVGHKDVLTKKKNGSVRGDKLKAHVSKAHVRAYRRWKERRPLRSDEADNDECADHADDPAELSLQNLVR